MKSIRLLGLLLTMLYACGNAATAAEKNLLRTPYVEVVTPPEQETEIKALVEQLVLADRPASNRPTLNPNMKIVGADGKEVRRAGESEKDAADYRKRFNRCQEAFQKLIAYKIAAFRVLSDHLDDKRQSINFRNHYLANSVGDACRWIIYFQLQDRPQDYSSYGYSRAGRDGTQHPKPYWEGTPFDAAGGVKQWLREHQTLTYLEMQIRCLRWLLDKEKQIGASDAASYFENILPLEIQILTRRLDSGEDVNTELARLRKVMANRDETSIPATLLPPR
ncbi:MAG: hypothetical protein LLG00_17310 [Planctomycetaceae bacterium]|nr:hypothetical protein [Planctomycetaceae bacterium]